MEKKLYVGNLAFSTTEEELRDAFAAHGEVVSVKVVTDRDTGKPRGFAFVEMATTTAAQAAIDALNETSFGGRTIQVNEARPQRDRGGFGGGGGGGGGRGGDRGGDRGERRPGGGGGGRSRW